MRCLHTTLDVRQFLIWGGSDKVKPLSIVLLYKFDLYLSVEIFLDLVRLTLDKIFYYDMHNTKITHLRFFY